MVGVQLVPARGALPAFSARGQPVVPVQFEEPGEHNRFAPLFDLEVVDLDDGVDAAAADDKKQPEKKTTRQRPRRSPCCTDDAAPAPVQKTSLLGLVGAFGILYATTAAVRAALRLALPRPVAHALAASYRTLTVHGNNPGFFAPWACGGARFALVILACTAAARALHPLASQPRRDLLASGPALLALVLAVAVALVGAGLA
ncbi:hypothetical protein EJB05_00154, partial [Eragrostis curvula]